MADKVKPLKIENASLGGTQNDPYPTETNPTQDYLSAKGVAFENSDTYTMQKNASTNNIETNSFEALIFTKAYVPLDSLSYVLPQEFNLQIFQNFKVDGTLIAEGQLIVME